jgi:hypothetical protein
MINSYHTSRTKVLYAYTPMPAQALVVPRLLPHLPPAAEAARRPLYVLTPNHSGNVHQEVTEEH